MKLKKAQVEMFRCVCDCAGEVLKMTQIARGLDKDSVLQIDIILNGKVPELPEGAQLSVMPYREKYIQTGPGNVFTHHITVITYLVK